MEYPPCKKCGKSHGMGIEDTRTGEITPIDLCYDCLWEDFPKFLKRIENFAYITLEGLDEKLETQS